MKGMEGGKEGGMVGSKIKGQNISMSVIHSAGHL